MTIYERLTPEEHRQHAAELRRKATPESAARAEGLAQLHELLARRKAAGERNSPAKILFQTAKPFLANAYIMRERPDRPIDFFIIGESGIGFLLV